MPLTRGRESCASKEITAKVSKIQFNIERIKAGQPELADLLRLIQLSNEQRTGMGYRTTLKPVEPKRIIAFVRNRNHDVRGHGHCFDAPSLPFFPRHL